MPARRIKEFLDSNNISYYIIRHSEAFSAQKIAASAHISGHEIAKTVIIKINGRNAMAVLPASYRVNFKSLSEVVGTEDLALANEIEFRYWFPDCEVGAMPPFGNLWGMEVFVAEKLTHCESITFNAGSHTELIQMAYHDYARLVRPKVFSYAVL